MDTIEVRIRTWAEDPEAGDVLGRLPLDPVVLREFAAFYISTHPYYRGDSYERGGPHFFTDKNGETFFEIVLDDQ